VSSTISFRSVIASIDRATFSAFRWVRLWLTLQREQVEEAIARDSVRRELSHQRKLWGSDAPLPEWARKLLDGPTGAPPSRPALGISSSERVAGSGRTTRESRKVDDVAALAALVRHLDAHRGLPISLVARSWAADHPQLGKRWSDPALRRLAAAGVLVKRRGHGRANAPTWHMIPLDEALRRL
jgi:hypothetical protein